MTSDERRSTIRADSHPVNGNGASDPARLDRLDRYWDAVTGNGYQRAEAAAIDPAHTRTIDQLQTFAHDRSAGMPPGARARIWRATATQAGIPTRQESPLTPPSSPAGAIASPGLTLPASSQPNGRPTAGLAGPLTGPGGRPAQPTGRALWPRLQFAVAAVLILGLFATILAPMDDERIGLFGSDGSTPTTESESGSAQFAGGGGHQLVPAFEQGLDLRLYQLTIPVGGSFDLPSGPAWQFQGFVGNVEFTGEGADPSLINPTRSGGSVSGGTLKNIVESESQVWLFGLVPRETQLATGSSGVALQELGRQDVSTLTPGSDVNLYGAYNPAFSDVRPLVAAAPPPEAGPQPLPGSATAGVVQAVRGQIRIDGTPGSDGPVTLAAGESATLADIGDATVAGQSAPQGGGAHSDTYYMVSVQPYVFGEGGTTESPAATDIPSIGYPGAFTGTGSLIDLPVSETGHTISLDRVTVAVGATLTLPAESARTVSSVTGAFTANRGGGSALLTVDQPSQIDIGLNGGSISADQGEDVTVTSLTIAPEGTIQLSSSNGVMVYPLTTYTTGELRFETQVNVLLGNGPAPVDPAPVPPNTNADEPQNLDDPGTTMLLFAEQGSITIDSPNQQVRRTDSAEDLPSDFATSLTIAPGESAIVSNPSEATIRQATPGEGAVYSVVFLSPPALDQTPGRTYPNTGARGGIGGPITVPADGRDYRVVLDRLTLDPGAIATFDPGTVRGVQWTGGGDVVMTVGGGGQSPLTFPNPSFGGSFGDQSFSLVASGDAPVTLTLLSFLATGATDETVQAGQAGVTAERLTTYPATNTSNATELQVHFSATAAEAFPVEIDFGLGLNNGRSISDSYALIRPEDGTITLDRPATRIVDGRETTTIAAGDPIPPGETVRVDDLLDATISGPTDGTPAGYTIAIISPFTDPVATDQNPVTPAALTGLTPASLDATTDLPIDLPVDVTLLRHTLGPGATLTVLPGEGVPTNRGELTFPIAVLTYAAVGDGTVTTSGQPEAQIASRSSELAMRTTTTGDALTITAGSDGLTVFQLVIGSGRPGLDSSGDVASAELGIYRLASTAATGIDLTSQVRVQAMLRATVGTGSGTSQNLGRDGTVTLLTPLDGTAQITPGVGEVRVADPDVADRTGTAITMPETVEPGGGVIAQPGGEFRVAPDDDPLSYLWAEIEITSDGTVSGTPIATPAAATPVAATPAVADVPACDIVPRTVEELLTLYDEGKANPVDPFTLGHRDDFGTGTPADGVTIDAVTDTLLRQAVCQRLNDPLRQYALYSDDYLRVILPLVYDSRDQLASLLEQPASQASAAALPDLSVSDVELFPDGRVGARVSLDREFAYVTFVATPEGTWLMDLFDDRDEPDA